MAGGTFDKTVGKTRPGTYINFESTRSDVVGGGSRGNTLIPLLNTSYGPAKEAITLTAASPDAAKAKLGYSVTDDDEKGNMLLIREAFKNSYTVVVYICTEGNAAATKSGGGLKATAKYKGTRGNNLSFSIVSNPIKGFDVEIYLDAAKVEAFEEVETVDDLKKSEYITFAKESEAGISAIAGVALSGGTDAETTNSDVTAFLDASESIKFNTMAFPVEESALHAACKSKINYLRENTKKRIQAVIPNFAGDYEGIINVTNGYKLSDREVSAVEATAFVAGITAGASNIQSNTNSIVEGAVGVVEEKNHEDAVTSIKAGELFFSVSDNGKVVIEYDINSLITYGNKKDKSYSKNRVIRVFDTFAESLQLNFPPNKYDNDPDGWEVMEGIGRTILKQYGTKSDGGIGAIKNVDYDNDFLVDTELSSGDETYFSVGLEPVDSAEKLYFTIATR